MSLILDVDYCDLCLSGHGDLPALTELFRNAKASGFETILWAPMACGKALYPSKVAEPLGPGARTDPGYHHFAEVIGRFDPLQEAVRLGREFDLEVLFYFRFFDDYYFGLEERFFQGRPDLWWQSRCGSFFFQGWPCYNEPEVRDYKMRLFREMEAYQPDGFYLEISRSHASFTTPQRAPHFFGYNPAVAAEYLRRYGVDIRAFDYVQPIATNTGIYSECLPCTYSVSYKNAAEFDLEAWHWLKGEAVDSFIRELRTVIPGKRLLMQGGACPPHPDVTDEPIAKFYIDPNRLAADGVIDGYSLSRNYRGYTNAEVEATFFPYFDGVREAGKPIGGWLNDILTADGGHGACASLDSVRRYIDFAKSSGLEFFVIHEADFIVCHEQAEDVWEAMRGFRE